MDLDDKIKFGKELNKTCSSIEELIFQLKANGFSQAETVIIIRHSLDISFFKANNIVFNSPTWESSKQQNTITEREFQNFFKNKNSSTDN